MADSRRPGPTRPPIRLRPAPIADPPYVDEVPDLWPRPPGQLALDLFGTGQQPIGRPAGRRPDPRPRPGPPGRPTTAPARHGHSRGDPGGAPVRRHLPGDPQRLPAARPDPGPGRAGAHRRGDRATRPRRVPYPAGEAALHPARRPPASDAGVRAAPGGGRGGRGGHRQRPHLGHGTPPGTAPRQLALHHPPGHLTPKHPTPGSRPVRAAGCPLAAQEREDARLLSRAGGRPRGSDQAPPLGAPWQRLYLRPEPHGQGALRDGPPSARSTGPVVRRAVLAAAA